MAHIFGCEVGWVEEGWSGGVVVWKGKEMAAAMAMVFIIDGILERNEKLASLHSSLVCCQ